MTALDVPAAEVQAPAAEVEPSRLVVVAVNQSAEPQSLDIAVRDGCVGVFSRYTTSGDKSLSEEPEVTLSDGRLSVTLDAQSVTTFVSR